MRFQRLREDLEKIELSNLAPYALTSARSRGRAYLEPESAIRTVFQRDRDRIIHTTAFRRLEHKTQVFIFYEGDHYRTRLTHTLEVSQLGRGIARTLGANEDLTEAICLAHDLGHPPFGHAGEYTLDRLLTDEGGFNHNTHSYRIVTELEHRYQRFLGLNLTYETREGILKHETEYDKSDAVDYEPEKKASLEAQIANFADEIAYNAHDLEDGLRAELFQPEALEELEIWQLLMEQIGWNNRRVDELTRRKILRELYGLLVTDVVKTSAANLEIELVNSPEEIQLLDSTIVSYSPQLEEMTRVLKDFLYERMYKHYRLMRMQSKAERLVNAIFRAYVKEPKMLPQKVQDKLADVSVNRAVADYIAGMTDRFAIQEWEKLFDPYTRA
jgi:dGTPase